MNPFDWSEDCAVGQPEIDKEHRALFRMAADLHDAMTAGRAAEELSPHYARLAAYTRFHSANEEALMRTRQYPHLERHLREHRELAAKVGDLERQFAAGTAQVDAATMAVLRRWLSNHILGTDRALS